MEHTLLPYNRSLHPDDYARMEPYLTQLRDFERLRMQGLPYRKDHTYREWEYAQILKQLAELFPDRPFSDITILDTGSGASYFPPLLKVLGYDITVSDSMAYGSIVEWLRTQCFALDIQIPLYEAPVEKLSGIEDGSFDVTMCISVIEHLPTTEFGNGLRELWRVTKPGGYLFMTSDFFRDWAHAKTSPSLGIQHNLFYPHTAEAMITAEIPVEWVGGVDFTYRGDFVNTHSFCTLCLRKPV